MAKLPILYSTGVCWVDDDLTVTFEGGDVTEAIATALTREYRFGGHTVLPYSVSEHSTRLAALVYRETKDPVQALQALWHEADEALGIRDINSLVKKKYGGKIVKLADALRAAVFEKLGLPTKISEVVHRLDAEIAVVEAAALLGSYHMVEWPIQPTWKGAFACWGPDKAYEEFRKAHREYMALWEAQK